MRGFRRPVKRASIYTVRAQTSDASGAATAKRREMRIGSDDTNVHACEGPIQKAFPPRLRSPSLTNRSARLFV